MNIRHLVLHFEAPLMSFGGDAVDAYGVVRHFPSRSAITGLIGNALGWDRTETDRLDQLQRRLILGSIILREGQRVRDFQTVQLHKNDRGWTTRGSPEKRAGGIDTYKSPHIRYRDAEADGYVAVVLKLDPSEEAPDIDTIAAALDRPERPLFLGRKPFLPSRPLAAGFVEAASIREALEQVARDGKTCAKFRAQWPAEKNFTNREHTLTDERNWCLDVHAGLRRVIEDWIDVS